MKLFGFKICPTVEFVDMLVALKDIDYQREFIAIINKLAWYSDLVPTGKVPALQLDDGAVLFESTIIVEYLDELYSPSIYPKYLSVKALNRTWMSWADGLLVDGYQMSLAKTEAIFKQKFKAVQDKLQLLENLVVGPFFNGDQLSLIDLKYAPLFKRFDCLHKSFALEDVLATLPVVKAWADLLLTNRYVMEGFNPMFDALLLEMLEYKQADYVLSKAL